MCKNLPEISVTRYDIYLRIGVELCEQYILGSFRLLRNIVTTHLQKPTP